MKEDTKYLSLFLGAFILVVITVALIGSLSTQTNLNTELTKVTDEPYNLTALSCYTAGGQVNQTNSNCNVTVTNAPTGWKQTDCVLTSLSITNNTGTALTLNTDYKVNTATGLIQFLNTTDTDSTSLGQVAKVDYSYCGDGYVTSSWGRSVLGVNIGLLAVAILLAIAGVVYLLLGKEL